MTYLGNLSLLPQHRQPDSGLTVRGFLCSRCTGSRAILPCLDWAVSVSRGDEPIMSTFHSELEAAVLDILITGTCPIILVLGRRLYREVPAKLRPLLDANRLLIISLSDQPRITRESAFACNRFISEQADALTFGFLSRDSSLWPLYEGVMSQRGLTLL